MRHQCSGCQAIIACSGTRCRRVMTAGDNSTAYALRATLLAARRALSMRCVVWLGDWINARFAANGSSIG